MSAPARELRFVTAKPLHRRCRDIRAHWLFRLLFGDGLLP